MRTPQGTFATGTPVKTYRSKYEGGRQVHIHRLRAERALGKPLPPEAVVHHADGSKSEHAPLVICENEAYHQLLHFRMRLKAAGADPNTERICTYCHQIKPIAAFRDHCVRTGKWHCTRCPELARRYRAQRAQGAGWGPEKAAKQRAWRHARKAARKAA